MKTIISNISDRQQIAQLLRARGTHALFSSSNTAAASPSTPLSSSLPLSASSRTSSASSSPPKQQPITLPKQQPIDLLSNSPLNSSPSFWPPDNAKSVTLYIAPRGRTRPSVSVEGLKVETFLRAAGVR